MKNKKYILIILIILVFLLVILLSSISFFIIYGNVKSILIKARNKYNKNCTESLIELINSENHPFKEKNDVIWALGHIIDKKTLPFLNELLINVSVIKPCNIFNYISKYEIEKAIKWCT